MLNYETTVFVKNIKEAIPVTVEISWMTDPKDQNLYDFDFDLYYFGQPLSCSNVEEKSLKEVTDKVDEMVKANL